MPRLFFAVPVRVRIFLLSLALLPCAPGIMFFAAGWMRDPPASVQNQRAAAQAHVLYHAGSLALGVGALCGAVVGWKLMRRHEVVVVDEP